MPLKPTWKMDLCDASDDQGVPLACRFLERDGLWLVAFRGGLLVLGDGAGSVVRRVKFPLSEITTLRVTPDEMVAVVGGGSTVRWPWIPRGVFWWVATMDVWS